MSYPGFSFRRPPPPLICIWQYTHRWQRSSHPYISGYFWTWRRRRFYKSLSAIIGKTYEKIVTLTNWSNTCIGLLLILSTVHHETLSSSCARITTFGGRAILRHTQPQWSKCEMPWQQGSWRRGIDDVWSRSSSLLSMKISDVLMYVEIYYVLTNVEHSNIPCLPLLRVILHKWCSYHDRKKIKGYESGQSNQSNTTFRRVQVQA